MNFSASLITSIVIGLIGFVSIAILVKVIMTLRRVVPTNMVHIVQTAKSTTSYGKGRAAGNTYYAWPSWVPVIGISVLALPESIFDVTLSGYDAYDKNRLPFMVDVKAFFRIENSDDAAQRASDFRELNSQLQSVIQGAVRRVLGTNELSHIMESRSELSEQFTQEVSEQIKEWGVKVVKAIEFMDIRDSHGSQVIQNIMDKEIAKIQKDSRVAVAEANRDASLAETQSQREVDLAQIEASQQTGNRQAEMMREVGLKKETATKDIAEANARTVEAEMMVKRAREVAQSEIDRDRSVIDADAQLQVETRAADAIKVKGEASAAAEQSMLMAPVNAQIALAEKISSSEGYQNYLVRIRQVEANEKVGLESAKALASADLKVIANSGDIHGGVNNLLDVLSPKGGSAILGMVETMSQTESGKELVDGLISRIAGKK